MLKHLWLILAIWISLPAQAAWDYDPVVRDVESGMASQDGGKLARMADDGLNRLVTVATSKIDSRGYYGDADTIRHHWAPFRHEIEALVLQEKMGDYAPLSQFLVELYDTLEKDLGAEVCHLLHFDDIWTFNYGVPVTFHLKSVTQTITAPEYALHFEPLSGVIAYWSVDIACMVGTEGAGLWWVCTPASMAARYVTQYYVAPQFSMPMWIYEYPM